MTKKKSYVWFLNDLSNGDRFRSPQGGYVFTYIWTFATRAAARKHHQEHKRNPKFADLSAPKKLSLRAVRQFYDLTPRDSVAKNYLRLKDSFFR